MEGSVSNHDAVVDDKDLDHDGMEFLAAGKSSIVYAMGEARVLKIFDHDEEMLVEYRAFARLGSHPNIVRLLETVKRGAIIVERGQCLRAVVQKPSLEDIPLLDRMRWVREAAEGVRYLHEKGIVYADVGLHNMILVHGRVKLIDFEGCSIDGEEASSAYEWFSGSRPMLQVSHQTDIFAFGCAIFEIMTGKPPYYEHITTWETRALVPQLYADRQFPETTHLPLKHVIQGCWHESFTSMDDIIKLLDAAASPNKSHHVDGHRNFLPRALLAKFFGTFWWWLRLLWRPRATGNGSIC